MNTPLPPVLSRCGLCCETCGYRESHGCGGCIATNGNPFHGECPVAKCCQDKGHTHCGECPQLPSDCGGNGNCGHDACFTCDKTTCPQLSAYSFADKEHGDNPPGKRVEVCRAWQKKNAEIMEERHEHS